MCGHILAGRLFSTRIVAQCMLGDLSAICGVFLKHVHMSLVFPFIACRSAGTKEPYNFVHNLAHVKGSEL
jgi:hypothetical protein